MFKRLALSMLAIALVSGLVVAGTFALFTAEGSVSDNTFVAGDVTLGEAASLGCNLPTGDLAPGDSSSCSFKITYSGSLNAWVGYTAVFGGELADKLSFDYHRVDGNDLVQKDTKYVVGEFAPAGEKTVVIGYTFAKNADDTYEDATGSLTLALTAVQARNNTTTINIGTVEVPVNVSVPDAWGN